MFIFILIQLISGIDVNLSYIDSNLLDIVWCGEETVLVLSSKGSIYRSTDKGNEWTKMSEIFHRKGLLVLQEEQEKVGVVNKIQRSIQDTQLVMFLGSEYVNWISPDCGQNINAIYTGRQMRDFQFHPTDRHLLLASSWSKCKGKEKDCLVTKDLMLSEDLGQEWRVIARYVNQYSWGARFSSDIPRARILISYDPMGTGHQQLSGWNMKTHFYYSDDYLKTKTMLVNSGNKFQITPNHIFVAQVMNLQNQEVTLLVSESNQEEYNFRYVQLPDLMKDHSYTIVDSQYGAFLNINHLKPSSVMGTTYYSDSTGTRYRVALNYTVRTEDGQCDFERVLGLEGIYIANVYNEEQAILYDDDEEARIKESDLNKFKQSRITFDKGSRWSSLAAPTLDSEGQRIKCDSKECSLHLHSLSTRMQFGPFYSTRNSIGVILGTGNVGKYLSYRADQVNTYMSRDGGVSWFEIAKGSHIFEIGDHGGIIILANDQQATKVIKYSWDEGKSWNVFKFSETAIEITNIITEPSNVATRFLIYGDVEQKVNDETISQGIIITLNFANLHDRECAGADNPGDDSDYEYWTPSIQGECLMGKKVQYVRRKREAKCFNGEDLERENFVEFCKCTEEDWECDLNYHRDQSGKCVPYELFQPDIEPPENCEDFYEITRGYRRVAGNQCQGGIEYNPVRLICPGFRLFKFRSIWDFVLILIFLAILYFIYKNKHLVWKQKPQQNQARAYGEKAMLGFREFDEDLIEQNI